MVQSQNIPQVSVIIPAYNAALYIAATLESALQQTYQNFEIIVVDDGSTDDTAAITRRYCDRGVSLISQPNAGLSAARNRALGVAKGEFISLLDSDDLWEPTYLETMVKFLDSHPETAIAFPDMLCFGMSKLAVKRFQGTPITFEKLLRRTSFICYSATLRREVFDRIGAFDPQLRAAEDFDFWLRALHAGWRIEPVKKVLIRYRRHAASMSLQAINQNTWTMLAVAKWRGQADLTKEESQAVESSYTELQRSIYVALALDNIYEARYSTAAEFLYKAHTHVPKWRYHLTRVGLTVAPGIVRFALRVLRPEVSSKKPPGQQSAPLIDRIHSASAQRKDKAESLWPF